MQLRTTRTNTGGSALIVTLLTAVIIGFVLASYLTLVSHQNRSVMRALSWNNCIPVAEAGIEEALTQIYYNGITNLDRNYWTDLNNGSYFKPRTFDDGSYCEVTIEAVDPPVIVATGYCPAPLTCYTQMGMVLGMVAESPTSDPYIRRTVRVTTKRPPIGLKAKQGITFTAGGLLDSFNSNVGPYNLTNRNANAIAITNSTNSNAIVVSSASIYGKVTTGPGGGVTYSTGKVGDFAWFADPNNKGIDPLAKRNDANLDFYDERVPFTTADSIPGSGWYGSTNAVYLLDSGNYKISTPVNLLFGKMIVTGKAVLFVDADFTVNLGGSIYIAPGASLQIYVSGNFTSTAGAVINGTGVARNLGVHGLNTCNQVTVGGSSKFIGTVNAPYATFTLSGTNPEAFGAFTAARIYINGAGKVHYDEALLEPYVATSWNEI